VPRPHIMSSSVMVHRPCRQWSQTGEGNFLGSRVSHRVASHLTFITQRMAQREAGVALDTTAYSSFSGRGRHLHDIVSQCGTSCQILVEGSTVSATTPVVRPPSVEFDVDQDIVAQCRNGDREAFAKLVQKYQSRVLTLATRILDNRSEAEDVAQDIFVKVFQSLHEFRGASRFSTWLYRITVNHCLNYLRRRTRQQQTLVTAEPMDWMQESPTSNPHRTLEQKERWALVQAKLQVLSPEYRTILLLRDFEGLSYEEIADVLQLESGTVKSRLHRARTELKALLEPYLAGEG
jgi:RNA polymerase sigma-70 factor (ECF subfamily)